MVGQGDFTAPPRYDGAGYAVLARSLAEGSGYRAIDHPDRPRHAHFPPGYPLLLALASAHRGAVGTWSPHGVPALHARGDAGGLVVVSPDLSPEDRPPAGAGPGGELGLGTAGTGIQSEPLYELLGQLTILVALPTAAAKGSRSTRCCWAACWPLACSRARSRSACLRRSLLDLCLRRRWSAAWSSSPRSLFF